MLPVRLGPVLTRAFFDRPCLEVAPELVGVQLVRKLPDGTRLVGRIVEVEAYLGDGSDPGSHSHRGQTPRNRSMFGPPARLYAYRIYGVHTCLNVVVEPAGIGAAILLRALEPLEGIETMQRHRGLRQRKPGSRGQASRPGQTDQAGQADQAGQTDQAGQANQAEQTGQADQAGQTGRQPADRVERNLARGPGRLAQALQLGMADDGASILRGAITLRRAPEGEPVRPTAQSRRIGLTQGADLPYRFYQADCPWVCRLPPERARSR